MIILVKSEAIALHCLQFNAVTVLPHSLQDIAVLQLDLSLAVELAILEISNINPSVLFAPFHPFVSSWSVHQVILEVASQCSGFSVKRSISLLLAVEELSGVADVVIFPLIISEAMHAAVQKLATIDLARC